RRGDLKRSDQPIVSEAQGDRRDLPRAQARWTHLNHGHRQREAALAIDRQRPQAVGQLNRRRSPGRRDVQAARGVRLHEGALGGRSELPLPEARHPELGRGLWREGRAVHGHTPERVGRMGNQEHWEAVYGAKAPQDLSWYRPHLDRSLKFIDQARLSPDAAIIDVGGGVSTLVEDLLACGYWNITLLDLSEAAIAHTRTRLGSN